MLDYHLFYNNFSNLQNLFSRFKMPSCINNTLKYLTKTKYYNAFVRIPTDNIFPSKESRLTGRPTGSSNCHNPFTPISHNLFRYLETPRAEGIHTKNSAFVPKSQKIFNIFAESWQTSSAILFINYKFNNVIPLTGCR